MSEKRCLTKQKKLFNYLQDKKHEMVDDLKTPIPSTSTTTERPRIERITVGMANTKLADKKSMPKTLVSFDNMLLFQRYNRFSNIFQFFTEFGQQNYVALDTKAA